MYCTLDDLVALFGEDELIQMTSRDQLKTIDEDKINRVIEQAQEEINGYISIRIKLPIDVIPPILNRISCNIARYRLYDDRVIDEVEKRYKDELALLKEIRDGKFILNIPKIDDLGTIDDSSIPVDNYAIQEMILTFSDSFFNPS